MPFVWTIGTVLGPSIGGLLVNPAQTMPRYFAADSIFATFPYLLPNLVCAFLLCFSILAGYFFLAETHPGFVQRHDEKIGGGDMADMSVTSTLLPDPNMLGRQEDAVESYGTFGVENARVSEMPTKIFTHRIIHLIVALAIFCYHQMTFDQLLPIFLQAPRRPLTGSNFFPVGGLGLTLPTVGTLLSLQGVTALIIQILVFPLACSALGAPRLVTTLTFLHPLIFLLPPLLPLLQPFILLPAIDIVLVCRNLVAILAYPVLLILIKDACPCPHALGSVNGAAAAAGAAARMVAPLIAGGLWDAGERASIGGLAWLGSALVALVGVVHMYWWRTIAREPTEGEGLLVNEQDGVGRKSVVVVVTETELDDPDV